MCVCVFQKDETLLPNVGHLTVIFTYLGTWVVFKLEAILKYQRFNLTTDQSDWPRMSAVWWWHLKWHHPFLPGCVPLSLMSALASAMTLVRFVGARCYFRVGNRDVYYTTPQYSTYYLKVRLSKSNFCCSAHFSILRSSGSALVLKYTILKCVIRK